MTDPCSSHTLAPSNLLLNLHMNLNTQTMVHDHMNKVKYRQPNTLHEPVLFEPLMQIRVGHATFKVIIYFTLDLI